MIRWNHDIYHEMPEYKEKIHQLKDQNAYFSHLIDRYHDVSHQLDTMQRHINGVDEDDLNLLKRQRLQIKDTLFTQLRTA